MSQEDIIRAWKEPAYRQHLSATERAELPPHPIGEINLTMAQLDQMSGGFASPTILTCGPSEVVTACGC